MSEGERPLLNQQGAQTGDQSYGSVAGRDITTYGIPAAILDDVREVQLRLVDVIERMGHDLRAELQANAQSLSRRVDRAKDEIALHEIAERQRRVRDDQEREERQAKLDAELAALRAEQQRTRRAMVIFGTVLLAVALIVGILLWDRYTALGVLRLWLGSAGTLAYQLWRGR